jgi:hypothetical protein
LTAKRSFLIDGHYGSSGEIVSDPSLIVDSGNGRPIPEEGATGVYAKDFSSSYKGAVYVVAGSSGQLSSAPLNHPAMYISLENLGAMVIDVYGSRLDGAFIGANGVVEDRFTLVHDPESFPPGILWAKAHDTNTLELRFTEPLDSATAQTSANYIVDGGLTVNVAALSADFRSVSLSMSPMTPGVQYSVTVTGVQGDRSGIAIPPPGAQAQFSFSSQTVQFQNGVSPDAGYAGTQDTYLRETSPIFNFGNETLLMADALATDPNNGQSGELVSLLSWDLSGIPGNATIDEAAVVLDVAETSPEPYLLFEMNSPWQENTATWNTNGDPAHRGTTVLGSLDPSQTGPRTVTLNSAGRSIIEAWVQGAVPNHGFVLASSGTTNGIDIHSSEGTAVSRPMLTVTYSIPTAPPGNAPTLNTVGEQNVPEGGLLHIPLIASDPDEEDTIALSALNLPAFAQFTDNGDGSGMITIQPGFSDAGTYPAIAVATDNSGLFDYDSFNIAVTDAPGGPLHVGAFTLEIVIESQKTLSSKTRFTQFARAQVTVTEENGQPAFGAQVEGRWAGSFDTREVSGFTDAGGNVIFDSLPTSHTSQGQYIFTVTHISLPGFMYDSAANDATSLCIDTAGADCSTNAADPPAPIDPSAQSGNGTVGLAWDYGTADGFNVYRSSTNGGPYDLRGTAIRQEFSDASVLPGQSYHYVVTALVGGVESPQSSQASVTVSGTPLPAMNVTEPISVIITKKKKVQRGNALLEILDTNGVPVDGALVRVKWDVIKSDDSIIPLPEAAATTLADGTAILVSEKYWARTGDRFRATVLGVSKPGYNYALPVPAPFGEIIAD